MDTTTTNTTRAKQTVTLSDELAQAIAVASTTPTDEAWALVATLAGSVQRRARLLAGLGRGG